MQKDSQEAQLFALLMVCKARENGDLRKRNIQQLDKKINAALNKWLQSKDGRIYDESLVERLARQEKPTLPKLQPSMHVTDKNETKDARFKMQRPIWSDIMKKIPVEEQNFEKERIHDFFFSNQQNQHGTEPNMPKNIGSLLKKRTYT